MPKGNSDDALKQAMEEAAASVPDEENEGLAVGEESHVIDHEVSVDEQGIAEDTKAMRGQLLRLAADFDNFRKRTRKDIEDARRFGIESLLAELLQVLDNQERALEHVPDSDDPVIAGVKMIAKQFHDVLERFGVKGFHSVGEKFDPERHEAMSQQVSDDYEPGTILQEVQKGYMIHDRLLRPARVIVAAGEDEAASREAAN